MTLGSGILWSTILLLLAAGIYQISVRKKWKLIAKVFAVLALIGTLLGLAIWGFVSYENRPQATTELGGIGLNSPKVAVSLALGEPTGTIEAFEIDDPRPGSEYSEIWWYEDEYRIANSLFVRFYGPSPDNLTTAVICQGAGYDELVGVRLRQSEDDVIERLGEPTHESINADGTSKYISYAHWNAGYEISRGRVISLCLTSSGSVRYGIEYGESD